MKKYFKIFDNLNKKDQKKLIMIIFGTILVSIFEVAGIVSIGPFIGRVTNSQIIFENFYLNYMFMDLNFNEVNNFLILLV